MQKVVEAGTARIAQFGNMVICGKTGTAQNPHGKDHSLFVAFAPRDNPKIAIAVMVENAGFGATWAAPIASLMMEKYLTDSITRPTLEEKMESGVILPSFVTKKDEDETDNEPLLNNDVTPKIKIEQKAKPKAPIKKEKEKSAKPTAMLTNSEEHHKNATRNKL